MAAATLGDGVVVVDDPGFAKQGQGSVGVARQYSGTLGQGGNCQVAVTCGSTDPQATWPVAGRWYLPEAWAEDAERRQQARVPAEVTSIPSQSWRCRCWSRREGGACRSAVGSPMPTLGTTPTAWPAWRADKSAMASGCGAMSESAGDVRPAAPCGGERRGSRPCRAGSGARCAGGRGPRGGRRKTVVAVRCWRVTAAGQRHVGSLVGERATRGQPEERKAHWSTLSATAPLEELAGEAPSPVGGGAVS